MVDLATAESVVVKFPTGVYIYTKLPPGKSKGRRWNESFLDANKRYSNLGTVFDSDVRDALEMGEEVKL